MHCHACWPRFCHDTFALLALNFYGVATSLYMPHTNTYTTRMQRLWLPRQAARQRSCCNLYAKLFYKLSKKDGVSRKHSRWHTHTLAHTSQQVASKWGKQAACRISHGFSFNCNCKSKRLQPQHLSMSSIRNSHRHSQSFCQIPCRCANV